MSVIFIGVCVYLFLPNEMMDSAGRYQLYESFQNKSFNDLMLYLSFRSDYIFYSLIFLFAYFNIKFQLLLFLFAVFNVGVPLFIFNKVIDKNKLSKKLYFVAFLLVFTSISLTFLFSGIRQLIGLNLIFLGTYHYFFTKNYKLSILFFLLAPLTHFSTFVFLPLIFIGSRFNVKFLLFLIFIFFVVGAILPEEYIQKLFLEIDTDSEIYNNKIQAYSNTNQNTETTTFATAVAKVLKQLWFYVAVLYAYISKRKHTRLFKLFLLVLLPISFLITFPGIAGRYIDFLKMIFVLVLLDDFLVLKNKKWLYIFLILFSLAPLYDIFRLMTSSFAYIYSFDHLTLFQILNVEYTTSDILQR